MIATWMLYGTVVALLAGLAALALERGARLLGRAGRWCWVGAMVVTLALPVAAWLHPPRPMTAAVSAPRTGAAVDLTGYAGVVLPITGASIATPFDWSALDGPLAYGWAFGSLALIGWFGVGIWRLAQMRKSWRWNGDIFVSNDVGPAVVGFLRCQVVVPEWSLQLGEEQRELLLAHEAEHLAAYDSRLLLLTALALALVPWNLSLWWQFQRLRLAIELDCDQRVLRRRPNTATYGQLLLDVGARAARTLLPVTAFHEPVSNLERRILSMTTRRPRGAGWIAAGLAISAAAAVFFACEAPRPLGPNTPTAETPTVKVTLAQTPSGTRYEELVTRCAAIADSLFRRSSSERSKNTGARWVTLNAEGRLVGSGKALRLSGGESGSAEPRWALPTGRFEWMVHAAPATPLVYCGVPEGTPGLAEVVPEEAGLRAANTIPREIREGINRALEHEDTVTLRLRATGDVQPDLPEASVMEQMRSDTDTAILRERREAEKREHAQGESEARERKETENGSVDEEARGKLREAVAKYYPQYVTQHANPPVVLWFNEGPDGALQHEQTLRTPGEGVGPVPADMGGGASLFKGWLTIGSIAEHRPDVTLVWVHHGRPPKENSESH